MNSSYTWSWMISRVPETQVCPDATKQAKAAPLAADTGSASSKTTIGAYRREQFWLISEHDEGSAFSVPFLRALLYSLLNLNPQYSLIRDQSLFLPKLHEMR